MAALIMSILIALGCVLCIGLMTMACYCFYARRKGLRNVLFFRGSGQLRDEEAENILPSTSSSVTVEHPSGNKAIGSGCSANTHPAYGMARKIRNFGMAGIGFRTPLIRTRSVGAQLDAGVSATLPLLTGQSNSPATGSAGQSASTNATPLNGRRSNLLDRNQSGSISSRTAGGSMGGGRGSPSMNGAAGPSTSSANSKHLVYGGGGGGGGGSASGDYNNGAGGGMNSLSAGGGGSSGLSSSPTSSAGDKGALAQSGAAGGKAGKASGEQHPSMAFWQNRSISLVDMYIDNSEPTENVGQIHFTLEYDFPNSTLILKIIQGKDLPAKDLSGTSDPYVRVTLLPDKKHRLETKIKRRTLNPRWNETFYFEGFPIQKLQSRVLHLHVFDYDRFSRDDSIGEAFVPLCQVDFSEKPSFWKALKPPLKDKCGELLVSLCYHPTNSTLTLIALKARNLKAKDINGKSDPYVKVWLYFGDKRMEKRKTPVYKCNLEPVFNETFTFNVPWEKIRECSLDVRVMDFDNIGRNELIGRISLTGKNSTGASETKHWQDMISKPRQAVVQWHRLKPE